LASTTADAFFERYGLSYRWLLTLTAMIGNIALILSSTIINVAIPDIMGAFGVGQDKAQWLSAGFLAVMTLTMLLNSWMIAAVGKRNTYHISMVVFVAGSVLGAVAPTFDMLVLARILQGFGAGLIHPLALQVIYEVFPPEQRGRAMGFFGFGIVLAPALGPACGGFLVDIFDWRAVFYMVLPFCALGSLMAVIFMPGRDPASVRKAFDWTGMIFMSIFLFSLLSGLSKGAAEGWWSDITLSYFGTAIVALVAFVIWEWRSAQPLLDLKVFAYGRFSAAIVISFVWGIGNFGLWYLVPLFVQLVQGYTATKSGLLLMPAGLLLAMVFPIAGRVSDMVPPVLPISIGLSMTAISSYWMTGADVNTPFWVFAWWLIFGRVGLGFVFPSLTVGGMRALPPHLISQGAGLTSYFRQLGAAFGITALATTVDSRSAMYGEAFISTQTAGNEATSDFLRTMQTYLSQAGTPEALQSPAALHHLGQTIFEQAQMVAFRDGFFIVALVFLAAIIPSVFLGRTKG
jgi:EmrB/QacA subfamily drug resistance transporter